MSDVTTSSPSIGVPTWFSHPATAASAAVPSWIVQPVTGEPSIPPEPPSVRQSLLASALALASLPPILAPRISVHLPQEPAYPDLREENALLRTQLAELALAMGNLKRDVLAASEPELVRLACAISERVVARELQTDPTLIGAWVREALEALGGEAEVTIFVAPDLAASLCMPDLVATGLKIETDPALSPGTCEVRTRATTIEASLLGRVDSVRQELGVVGQ